MDFTGFEGEWVCLDCPDADVMHTRNRAMDHAEFEGHTLKDLKA
jgi:hypothetical protein